MFIAPAQTPVPDRPARLFWPGAGSCGDRRASWCVRPRRPSCAQSHTRVPRNCTQVHQVVPTQTLSRINLQRRPSFLPAVCAGALNGVDVDNLLRSSASTLAVVRQGRHDRRHRFVESAACARFRQPFHRAFMCHSGPVGERPGDDGRCQQAAGRPGPFRLPRG
jgi:hypothetical protein